ncbi:hypothetical protein AB0399_28120 [Streptomyces sp. NPDC088194]|uniref:hypothetical protein n=1 Tax=Streptomyces sp. NPDC088194 TaxID=3154931 RepID=UPI00344C9EC2
MAQIGLRVSIVMGIIALVGLTTTQFATAATGAATRTNDATSWAAAPDEVATPPSFDVVPTAATADAALSPGMAKPGKCILLAEEDGIRQASTD